MSENSSSSCSLIVRFWGVRGSYPVPGMGTAMFGGNTSCVEVEAGNNIIIIDAGTGIINLGRKLLKKHIETKAPTKAYLLFSHMHHDHTQGWPFFAPAFFGSSEFHIFGANMFGEDLEKTIYKAMTAPNFPVELSEMKSVKTFHTITDSNVIVLKDDQFIPEIYNRFRDKNIEYKENDTKIRILKGYAHPKGGILYFKIERNGKKVVYASDTEGYKNGDAKLANFANGVDLLIHDAQYEEEEYDSSPYTTKEGWGHSTPEMAVEIAQKSEVTQLVLFHHDPLHDDDRIMAIENKAKKKFPNTAAAYEVLEICL
jgi:phosphoribosyl 1,2-cyclic phosphodiesterase